MRDCYAGTAAALRDALRHAVERGGVCSLGVLHQGVPSAATLTGDASTAQAGRIRRQLDRMSPVPRALLVVAYAPRDVVCNCRAPCCSGRYPNPEWRDALDAVVAHTAPLLVGHAPNVRLRAALVANLLTRTHETAVSLSAASAAHRNTVAEHTAILEAALMGTRHASGEFDAAFARIDALLREAGIVTDGSGDADTVNPKEQRTASAGIRLVAIEGNTHLHSRDGIKRTACGHCPPRNRDRQTHGAAHRRVRNG